MGSRANSHSESFSGRMESASPTTPPRRVLPPNEDVPSIELSRISKLAQRTGVPARLGNATDLYNLPDFETIWSQKFSVRRTVHDDRIFIEIRKKLNAVGGDLDIFYADHGDTASCCAVEVVVNFCRGIEIDDVASGRGSAGTLRNAWLDEKSPTLELEGIGETRQHNNPLTAYGLYKALKTPRYNQDSLPDASRRLIYVSDLDPACIHALVATASCHQAPVLGNAIYQHLHFQTSIAVSFPSAGFLTFTLALHLPFFLISNSPPEHPKPGRCANTKPQRAWTDLSFLELDDSEALRNEPKKSWGMYEAHISCVVTGTDDWRWVCYGFVDAVIDGFLHELSEDDELAIDQIASGCLPVDAPVWRPRDYWLKVFELRINLVAREWEYLIHKVEFGIYQYTKKHSFTLAGRCGIAAEEDAEIKQAFDWTVQTMGLLRRIDGVLSNTVKAWQTFSASDGDIGYFRPTPETCISPPARRSLHAIRASFRSLEDTQKKINLLNKCCSQFKENLQLRLFVEGKETADGNETTSEFTVSVLYPIALVAAIFSMQQQAIPFHLSPRSFTIASFLMIIIVYTSRLFARCFIPRWFLLRRAVVSWVGTFGSEKGVEVESRLDDEERDALGTRAMRGNPAES